MSWQVTALIGVMMLSGSGLLMAKNESGGVLIALALIIWLCNS